MHKQIMDELICLPEQCRFIRWKYKENDCLFFAHLYIFKIRNGIGSQCDAVNVQCRLAWQ